jgi:hypothetical protein
MLSILKKLVPFRIKIFFRSCAKKIWGFKEYDEIRKEFLLQRQKEDEAIPKIDLQPKHIKNLKVVLDRIELLRQMPKNSICAEIGVEKGDFSQKILEITLPKKLHLIDKWNDPSRYHDGLKTIVEKKFSKEIATGQIEINVGLSTEVLKNFPDYYFDWVYLDTDHTYKVTAEELSILKHKVKKDGIIAGHDYIIGNWAGNCRYGVIEAVHELCVKDDWELIYITINSPSFVIKKII